MMPTWLPIGILVIQFVHLSIGATNGTYIGPPMGWISYRKFGCEKDCKKHPTNCIGETLVKRTAKALVSKGFRDLGYQNIVLDGCWENGRHAQTRKNLISESQFPSGMKELVIDVHKHCLNFGLLFSEECRDVKTITADYEVALEFDLDFASHYSCSYDSMVRFRRGLDQHKKSILTSCASTWLSRDFGKNPSNVNWTAIQSSCNTWRTTDWPRDDWSTMLTVIRTWATHNKILREKSGPGHWVDLITLMIHAGHLTQAEKRTNMGMWCLMSSPLLFSDDLDTMNNQTYELLTNKRLIAIDQDPSKPPKYLATVNGIQIWVRQMSTAITWVVAFVNENDKDQKLERPLNQLITGIPDPTKYKYQLTDVFTGVNRGLVTWQHVININVRAHDTEMYFVRLDCNPGNNKLSL